MPILSTAELSFPFETDSPFLFAVYHHDKYPPGNEKMGIDKALLSGHRMGADFGHPSGWNMYHGEMVPGFPKHPHRGFETITVTRKGVIDHTDSLGHGGRFGFGDTQWMTAGAGVVHSEMFPLLDRKNANENEFFQIWINLPRRTKFAEPSFKMLWAEDLSAKVFADSATGASAEVQLVAGTLPGFAQPPSPPPDSYASEARSDVLIVSVRLSAKAAWTLPAYEGEGGTAGLHRNVYFYSGSALTIDGRRFEGGKRVKVEPGAPLQLVATAAGPAQVLVLQGRDIGEPVVQHGPFVGETQQDIQRAFSDYRRTQFGGWPWESDSVAFPREKQRFAQCVGGTFTRGCPCGRSRWAFPAQHLPNTAGTPTGGSRSGRSRRSPTGPLLCAETAVSEEQRDEALETVYG
jgi:hypothetical protein